MNAARHRRRIGLIAVIGLLLGAAAVHEAPAADIGELCVFDNFIPLDDLGGAASQLDMAYPFYAEAASDFVLACDGVQPHTPLQLKDVQFFVWMTSEFGASIEDCWEGVRVTIYEDGAEFCGPGFNIGPAGKPLAEPAGKTWHMAYCPESIVCEMGVAPEAIMAEPLELECIADLDAYSVRLLDVGDTACILLPGRTYWIAIAPIMRFDDCDQTIMLYSHETFGWPDMQIFELIGFPWTVVAGNDGMCPPPFPSETRDLAIAVETIVLPSPADLNEDGSINSVDLAIMLGSWGPCPDPPGGPPEACPADIDGNGVVGPSDLAILLGHWG